MKKKMLTIFDSKQNSIFSYCFSFLPQKGVILIITEMSLKKNESLDILSLIIISSDLHK